MKKYEVLEHKADLKLRVFGKNKEELFVAAVLGMEDSLRPKLKTQNSKLKTVKIASWDLKTLLVDFLSEVLYFVQTDREIYHQVRFIKFSDKEIKANLFGKKADSFGRDIKAVTHHQLDLSQKKDGTWQATITFDV